MADAWDKMTERERFPPDFADLKSANEEIFRLRKVLATSQNRVALMVVAREKDHRALKGQVRALQLRVNAKGLPPNPTIKLLRKFFMAQSKTLELTRDEIVDILSTMLDDQQVD